jgi:hypothetical protein
MATVISLRNDFDADLKRASDLLEAVQLPYFQLALIYELAFLRCFLAWEIFLEETFYAYMLSKPSPDGTTYGRYVRPRNLQHARKLVRGEGKFSAWANSKMVLKRADLFFDQGEPFSTGLAAASGDLADMGKVRNRIAHRSGTAKSEFLELVRQRHGSVPQGTNAGRFLLGKDPGVAQGRFHVYLSALSGISRVIAP